MMIVKMMIQAPSDGAGRTVTIMPVLTILISLLSEMRAHIPNQPRFGSGPANASNSAAPVHLLAIVLIAVTLTLTALWLAVGLAIRVL
jgi:hypothetical protein